VLRADASVKSGTGQLMRSIALAQAWQDTGVFLRLELREEG
jgi:spore coat polysaccharide biosynthesis predicted glycosyltransferase SpsG